MHGRQRYLVGAVAAIACTALWGDTAAGAACRRTGGLPDSHCTPGARAAAVTPATIGGTICKSGYTKTVRPPTSQTNPIKVEREIAYGIPGPHPHPFRTEELDHLIPLELGGAPKAQSNLWPEPAAGAFGYHLKDKLETRLKRLVCAGSLKLRTAQQAIARNWKTAYAKYVKT